MSLGTLIQSVCYLWLASEIALIIFRRTKDTSSIRDASSITWLNIGIYGSLAISLTLAFSRYGIIDFQRYLFAWVGLFLIIARIMIHWSAMLTLRRLFTVNVAIQDHHRPVKTGL